MRRTGLALLAALAVLAASARADACASCGEHAEVFVGVDEQGRLVTVATESTGESDWEQIWVARISRGTTSVCTLEAEVEKTSVYYRAAGGKDCEALLGLGAKQRAPDRAEERYYKTSRLELSDFIAKIGARSTQVTTQVASPADLGLDAVAGSDGYRGGDEIEQPLTIDGVHVGHVSFGASHWALATYTHPRFDGIIVRLITLIASPDQRLGSSSGCTDYFDGHLAIPRARVEAARLIALARRATTPVESLAFAQRAADTDPTWSGAQNELRRRQRRIKSPR